MSVITPAFPCMNSSHMITDTTLEIITNFFKDGYKIINLIKNQTKTWSDLFKKFDFFNEYPHFIEIDILAKQKKENEFKAWEGFIMSKIRKLYLSLERSNFLTNYCSYYQNYYQKYMDIPYNKQPLTNYFFFHLFPEAHPKTDSNFEICKAMFYGMKAKDESAIKNQKFDFITSVQDFCIQIKNDYSLYNNGKFDENLQLKIFQIRKEDITKEILEKKSIKIQENNKENLKRKFSQTSQIIQDNVIKQIHHNETTKLYDPAKEENILNDLLN